MNETGTTLALLLKTIVADGGGRGDIHPYKELTEGVMLTSEDAAVLWTVFVTPTDQFSEMRSTRLSGSADLILARDDPGGACRARDEARG